MKRQLISLLLMCTLGALSASAQNSDPAGRWRICLEREDGSCTFEEMETHGYVVKNGVTYVQVTSGNGPIYIREADDKVYLLDEELGTEVVLLDYGLKVGDEFEREDEKFTVLAVSETMPYGRLSDKAHMLRLKEGISGREDVWIKGIGSLATGVMPPSKIPQGLTPSLEYFYSHKLADMAFFGIDKRLYKSFCYEPKEIDNTIDDHVNYEFHGDTLHVKGAITTTCAFPFYLSATIDNDRINLMQFVFPEQTMACRSTYLLDFNIPKIPAGTYTVSFGGAFPATVTCEDLTSTQEWDHEYVPFVEEGKVWYCHAALPFNTNVHSIDCILTLRGDTLIADQTYKKVLCQYEMYYGDNEQHYFCGVREEAYKVFLMESDTQEEKLLCDFSQPKDTLFFSRPEYEFARLPERHYSRYPDNMFRYDLCSIIDGKANRSYDWGHWVESVGYVYSNPFECKFRREEGRKLQPPVAVLTCMIGDKCLYYHDWDAEPHGIDETTITSTSNETLFDLQGRPLSTPPSRGMYIQNGKKVIK